jgi:hypothetical protein
VTLPLESPPRTTPPPFSYLIGRQVGITIGEHQPKWTWIRIGSSVSLPQQPHLVLVTSNSKGASVLLMLTKLTHLPLAPS